MDEKFLKYGAGLVAALLVGVALLAWNWKPVDHGYDYEVDEHEGAIQRHIDETDGQAGPNAPIYDWDKNEPVDQEEWLRQNQRSSQGSTSRPGFITGNRVTYVVPDGTSRIVVQIQESNGRLIQEFTITEYFKIQPGQRLQLRAE